LNEVFVAEKDMSSASRFRLVPNGQNLGLFKSSGLIISTGTGSSGWLYAARQVVPLKLVNLAHKVGSAIPTTELVDKLSKKISDETLFGADEERMFFFVREGFALT